MSSGALAIDEMSHTSDAISLSALANAQEELMKISTTITMFFALSVLVAAQGVPTVVNYIPHERVNATVQHFDEEFERLEPDAGVALG